MVIPRLRPESSDLPRLVLSLATLSIVGFSLVLAAQLLWLQLPIRNAYALSNALGTPGRNVLLVSLAAGLVLPSLVGLLVLMRVGERGVALLQRWARLLAPLSLTFVVPGLFLSQLAEAKPLFYLVVLSAFGLALRALLTTSLEASRSFDSPRLWRRLRAGAELAPLRLPNFVAPVLVTLAATGYALFLGRYAIGRHRLLQAVDTDLAIANNVMANLLHGHWTRAPAQFGTGPGNYLAEHGEYGALLFLPVYRMHPSAETLLWLQAALAALSVIPLFFLAARLLGQRLAVWACLAFLSLAPLHAALLHGFSWLPALCLFSFVLFYAVVAERPWLVVLALPAVLVSSDAGPLAVFALGAFLLTARHRLRLGLLMCLLAALMFAVNSRFAARSATATPQLHGFEQALKTLLTNPVYFVLDLARAAKITSMLHALAPLLLLPLGALRSVPLLVPGILFTSSSSEFWPAARAAYPFGLVWIPGALLSVLFALHRLRVNSQGDARLSASVVAMSLALLSHSYDFGALLRADGFAGNGNVSSQFRVTPRAAQRYRQLHDLVERIPARASVVATPYLLSHVSNRPDAFDAQRPHGEPEYVLLSSLEVATARDYLSTTFAGHGYRLAGHSGEFYLFNRGAETAETSNALRSLGLLPSDAQGGRHE